MPQYSRNVIYFPFINVPQKSWFSNVLLYWEKVYSIVPYSHKTYPILMTPYMRDMVAEHLVIPLSPIQYLDKILDFEEKFLSYVDRPDYPIPRTNKIRDSLPTEPIHLEKLGNLSSGLEDRHLASNSNYPWFNVESYTANQFMLYLSTELGKIDDISGKPVTDSEINYPLFNVQSNKKLQPIISKIRPIVLDALLPSPLNSIDPRDILSFKDDHKNLLISFRNNIEEEIINIASNPDPILQEELLATFIAEKKTQIYEIIQVMEERKWDVSFSKLLGYCISNINATAGSIFSDLFQKNEIKAPENIAYAVIASQKYQPQS